jgi:acyl-CoA reductase-like NAD-dependent aldehyde dehydrogenase
VVTDREQVSDGQWHSSSNKFETINPATEEVIAAVTNAGAEEVNHGKCDIIDLTRANDYNVSIPLSV